ncbi:MAG: hypothetical protein IT178_01830 [Acidobacteria bacterium]|nr:hypothetical protein [Acidobacteriota bacterium]
MRYLFIFASLIFVAALAIGPEVLAAYSGLGSAELHRVLSSAPASDLSESGESVTMLLIGVALLGVGFAAGRHARA